MSIKTLSTKELVTKGYKEDGTNKPLKCISCDDIKLFETGHIFTNYEFPKIIKFDKVCTSCKTLNGTWEFGSWVF